MGDKGDGKTKKAPPKASANVIKGRQVTMGTKRKLPEGRSPHPNKVSKIEKKDGQKSAVKTYKIYGTGATVPMRKKKMEKASKKTEDKPKLFEMTRKERKKIRQQQDNKFYQLQLDAKKLWEKLRRSDVRSEEKHKVANELHQLIKGKILNVVEAHDTSRVVECLYANGSHEIKNSVFEEIKDKIIHYSKCKYAKNVILACLRHGSQAHKEAIFKAVQTRVAELFLHKEAALVISSLFDDFCNNVKKAEMAQEFYSRELVYFKSEDATTFQSAYDKCTDKTTKENMLSEFKEKLLKLTDKGVVKYGLYHLLLSQLFAVLSDKTELLDMIRQIQHILVEIVHTKEGLHVALQCVWHSTAKERKTIAKSFKPFVNKIATDDQGHKALMGLFDAVDDTVMLNQTVITELMKNREKLLQDKFGSKVLVYLMVGRDPRVITPATIELLKQGDGNEHSKKSPELRRKELRGFVQQPLIETICENLSELITTGETSVAVRDIILAADPEFRIRALSNVVKLLETPYAKDASDHIVENKHGNFFIKKLLINDKDNDKAEFARLLMEQLGEDVVRSWWKCNRGAFLCVSLVEVKDSKVQKWAKTIFAKDKSEIAKEKDSKGAEILLQKL